MLLFGWEQIADFFDTPNVVADTSFHRRSDAQSLMDSAEVVVQIQRNHVPMIVYFL